jgi:hypothetical protein
VSVPPTPVPDDRSRDARLLDAGVRILELTGVNERARAAAFAAISPLL